MVLAYAGVVRLGMDDRIGEILPTDLMLPAVGQGALAIEVRSGDRSVLDIVRLLHDESTAQAVTAERSFLARMEGGCQIPIGTHGRMVEGDGREALLRLDALVGSLDGSTVVRGSREGPPGQAAEIGGELAEELIAQGAGDLLRAIREQSGPAGDEPHR
jgi:hydroxymethylbilane synthase